LIPVQLAHFNKAERYRYILLITGSIFAGLGFFLVYAVLLGASNGWLHKLPIPKAAGYLGSALLIPAAGFLSAGMLAAARYRHLAAELHDNAANTDAVDPPVAAASGQNYERFAIQPRRFFKAGTEALGGWPQVLVAIAFALSAVVGVVEVRRASWEPALAASMQQVIGGVLLVCAFPLLVLERSYANLAARTLPEAPQLNRLLRAALTACVGLGIATFLSAVEVAWGAKLEAAIATMIVMVAAEMAFRASATFFIPFAPLPERRSVADSSIAGFFRFAIPSFNSLNASVQRQFGIDLSRSWALGFVRRALLPVTATIGVAAWCVTGVTALGIDQRAVYERLGVPVAVFGPGLHLHLPWPLGIMRNVELGVVHEIPIVFEAAHAADRLGHPADEIDPTGQLPTAEAPAPANADRLWDASHPGEASYLIASETRGQQGFQIANIDLRVVYRVGLSEDAAREAAYRIDDPEALIRGVAGRLLVRYFARYTLLDVLGQSREIFTDRFHAALQDELDRMSTGIEAISVIVEAIHPPAGAAQAYHAVQAAQILANSQIALMRGEAISRIKSAQQAASRVRDAALATAAELVDRADSEGVLFDADHQSYRRDGQAFLLERRFDRLSKGLANSELLIIDHRLNGQNAPTIDLRRFSLQGGGEGLPPPRKDDLHSQSSPGGD
jgi:regulator of protease activity HflC (stomatin/prohibitin superfamily)